MRQITLLLKILLVTFGTILYSQVDSDPYDLTFNKVTETMTVVNRPDMGRFPVIGNAVIFSTDDGVVLIDGGGSVPVAERIIKHIQWMTDKPLKYVVLTHWHNDHSMGNDLYQTAYPDVKMLAHPFTINYIDSALVERASRGAERIRSATASFRHALDTIKVIEGDPISERDHLYHLQALMDTVYTYPAIDVESVAVPDLAVNDREVLHLGDLTIDVRFIGKGNTPGDLIVWVPELKTMISGDIITHPIPFGYPRDWLALIETIDAMNKFPYRWLIPGHGDIQKGKKYAKKVRGLYKRTSDRIEKMVARGMTKAEVAEAMDFSKEEKRFFKNDPAQIIFFRSWFIPPALDRKYDQARAHQGLPPEVPERE